MPILQKQASHDLDLSTNIVRFFQGSIHIVSQHHQSSFVPRFVLQSHLSHVIFPYCFVCHFYLGKEQISYLGLESEYNKQMEHAVEGVNMNLEDIDDSVNDILFSGEDGQQSVDVEKSANEIVDTHEDVRLSESSVEDGSTATETIEEAKNNDGVINEQAHVLNTE